MPMAVNERSRVTVWCHGATIDLHSSIGLHYISPSGVLELHGCGIVDSQDSSCVSASGEPAGPAIHAAGSGSVLLTDGQMQLRCKVRNLQTTDSSAAPAAAATTAPASSVTSVPSYGHTASTSLLLLLKSAINLLQHTGLTNSTEQKCCDSSWSVLVCPRGCPPVAAQLADDLNILPGSQSNRFSSRC